MRVAALIVFRLLWLLAPVLLSHTCTAAVLDRGNLMDASNHAASSLQKRRVPVRTSEPDAALLMDPYEQCTKYKNPMTQELEPQYPERWKTASIVPGDLHAQALFEKINATAPNIAPKGNREGNIDNVAYDSSDPDCWRRSKLCVQPKNPSLVTDTYTCNEPHTYGLTFDDGPNCSHNAFYDYLLERNQKATMFYIGSNIMRWPLQAQRGAVEGHHICGHTWSHPHMVALTNEQIFAELYYTARAAQDVMQFTMTCWRPPYGDVDDRVRHFSQALGLETIVWDRDTRDFDTTVDEPKAVILQNYTDIQNDAATLYQTTGNIVLAHEQSNFTMSIFISQLDKIQSAFKYVVPVSVCNNITRPYLENIIYPNFADWIAGNGLATGLPNGGEIHSYNYTLDPTNPRIDQIYDFVAARKPVVAAQTDIFKNTTWPTAPYAFAGNQTRLPEAPEERRKKRDYKLAIGISIGGAAFIAIVLVVLSLLRRQKRKVSSEEGTTSSSAPNQDPPAPRPTAAETRSVPVFVPYTRTSIGSSLDKPSNPPTPTRSEISVDMVQAEPSTVTIQADQFTASPPESLSTRR